MTSLTVEFRGVTESVLEKMVELGYAKTKTEALRYAILQTGRDLGLLEESVHKRAQKYMEEEIVKRFARIRR